MSVEIRKTTVSDVYALMQDIRDDDFLEVYLATGKEPGVAIASAVEVSLETWACWYKGKILAVYGLAGYFLSKDKSVWLIGTRHLDENHKVFMRETKKFFKYARSKYDLLYNYVHVKNLSSVIWLEHEGFTFYDPEPYGPFGAPFQYFEG